MLIVGAACLVVITSTSAYLYRRGSGQHKRKRPPAQIEVSSPKHGGLGMVSPIVNLNLVYLHRIHMNISMQQKISLTRTMEGWFI